MTVKYFALLTNLGAAKLANAAALGTQLQITQMAVGDGGGALPTPNPAQTQLIAEKRRAALNSLSIDAASSSQIIAEQVIPETDGGWWIREVGLFDKDGILIAVANCPETYKPQLQEGSGRTQTVRMVLIVSSTEAVTLKIDPSVVLATRKYADDKAIEVKQYTDSLLSEHEVSRNHPDASKTERGFVKLSSATDSTSETLAATPKAIKAAIDASLPLGGTAAAATKLATARKIGGVDFDGTKDIALPFISATDTNIQLPGNLGTQGNITAQGSIIAKTNIAADGRCDIVGDVRGGRLISKGDVVAGEGRAEGHATLTVDGNIRGTVWGTDLYTYITDMLIGIPMPHPLGSVPARCFKCNGATFSTSLYPKLALKFPSGVLPDMRGDVIRGWDDGRGVDPGRALLSEQGFAMQNITGSLRVSSIFADPGTAATGAFTVSQSGVVGEGYNAAGLSPLFTFNAANVVATAAETRMRNIAFNYIVRAL